MNTDIKKIIMAHTHNHSIESYNKYIVIGIILNLLFVFLEIFYGIISSSMALIADAGHNFSDVLSLVLALTASLMIKAKSTAKYTYGFKKGSILIAAVNSMLLIAALGGISWEAIQRLYYTVEVKSINVIIVAAIGIIINGVTAAFFMKGKDKDLNIKSAFLHMLTDALISAGVVVSGILMLIFDIYLIDPLISIAIVFVIFIGTWKLFMETIRLSVDAVPEKIDIHKVRGFLTGISGVINVHDLHIWSLSTSEIALTAHLKMKSPVFDNTFNAEIKKKLHDKFGIEHTTIQVESDEISSNCSNCEESD